MGKAVGFVGSKLFKGNKGALSTQFMRFVVVGGFNTAVDLAVLNALIYGLDLGHDGGIYFLIFKSIAFTVAVINSYVMNKLWTFEASGKKTSKEAVPFLIVSVVGLILNVAAATLFVTYLNAPFEFLTPLWPSFGGLMGTAAGLMWNFVGYKTVVFNKAKAPEAIEEPAQADTAQSDDPALEADPTPQADGISA